MNTRRDFLKKTLLVAGASAVPSVVVNASGNKIR